MMPTHDPQQDYIESLEQRLATAEADNAALLSLLLKSENVIAIMEDDRGDYTGLLIRNEINTVRDKSHPGTALTQRLMEMEELLRTAIRIFESKEMVSVCMVSQIHHAPYSGEIFPTEKAKQALEGK